MQAMAKKAALGAVMTGMTALAPTTGWVPGLSVAPVGAADARCNGSSPTSTPHTANLTNSQVTYSPGKIGLQYDSGTRCVRAAIQMTGACSPSGQYCGKARVINDDNPAKAYTCIIPEGDLTCYTEWLYDGGTTAHAEGEARFGQLTFTGKTGSY